MTTTIIQKLPLPFGDVPPISPVIQRLCTISVDEELGLKKLAEIIATDPALTARVLHVANSSFFGQPATISDVARASVVIGIHGLRQIAIGLGVKSAFKVFGKTQPAVADQLWRHSVATAVAAQVLAGKSGHKNPNECFVAGLLHDIGKLVWLCHDTSGYAEVLNEAAEGAPLHEVEKRHLRFSHADAGKAFCLHWKLPIGLARAVGDHHRPTDPKKTTALCRIVKSANELAKLAGIGSSGNAHVEPSALNGADLASGRHIDLAPLIGTLPAKVHNLEALLATEPEPDEEDALVAGDSSVLVILEEPGERELVTLTLASLGYRVITHQPEDPLAVRGLVTDSSLLVNHPESIVGGSAAALDFGGFRDSCTDPDSSTLRFGRLREWLSAGLTR